MAVFGCAFFVAPSPAAAAPITYTLSDASATFTSPPGKVTLTGTFTFDPSGPTLISADIMASNMTGSLLDPNPDTFTSPATATANEFLVFSLASFQSLDISFSEPLGASPDMLSAVTIESGNADICNPTLCASESATGDAVPSTVPEPASLTLLGAALAVFRFARGRTGAARRA
jgi:hypothetical protein